MCDITSVACIILIGKISELARLAVHLLEGSPSCCVSINDVTLPVIVHIALVCPVVSSQGLKVYLHVKKCYPSRVN